MFWIWELVWLVLWDSRAGFWWLTVLPVNPTWTLAFCHVGFIITFNVGPGVDETFLFTGSGFGLDGSKLHVGENEKKKVLCRDEY